MSRECQRSIPGAHRGIRLVSVSTSLIRIDRMAIPVAGSTCGGACRSAAACFTSRRARAFSPSLAAAATLSKNTRELSNGPTDRHGRSRRYDDGLQMPESRYAETRKRMEEAAGNIAHEPSYRLQNLAALNWNPNTSVPVTSMGSSELGVADDRSQ
jgi:hypothetical protein